MSLILTSIISALAPAGIEVVKDIAGGIGRKIGGLSVEDEIKIKNADIERLKAVALLDTPAGNISPWVSNLRASFRYVAASVFVIGGFALAFTGSEYASVGLELAATASSFIFGERMLLSLKSRK